MRLRGHAQPMVRCGNHGAMPTGLVEVGADASKPSITGLHCPHFQEGVTAALVRALHEAIGPLSLEVSTHEQASVTAQSAIWRSGPVLRARTRCSQAQRGSACAAAAGLQDVRDAGEGGFTANKGAVPDMMHGVPS